MAYTRLSAVMSAIATAAGQTAYTVIGTLERARRDGPPRVVWAPGGGEVTNPDQDESDYSKIGYQRNVECTVYFLAGTYDAAETLLINFLAALRQTQSVVVVPGREESSAETIAGAQRYEISLELIVQLPVPFETYTAANVDQTAAVITDTTVTD